MTRYVFNVFITEKYICIHVHEIYLYFLRKFIKFNIHFVKFYEIYIS